MCNVLSRFQFQIYGNPIYGSYTNMEKLLVIHHVWAVGCAGYINLQVAQENLLETRIKVKTHSDSSCNGVFIGNMAYWWVKDFWYAATW
jgi:hypothetical protein